MSEAVTVAIITGGLSLIGTIITVLSTYKKTAMEIKVNQAVTDTKIDELTREVRLHNNFAQRLPVVEEQIKNLDGRVDNIEKKV